MKKLNQVLFIVVALCISMSFSMTISAENQQTQSGVSTTDVSEGEFIADYVMQVVEFLNVYAKDGVSEKTLYKAALIEVLTQHPELYETVMGAMLGSIDEHSVFYRSGEFESFISQLEGSVGGIGITFNEVEGNLTIGAVYENTPAMRAGILPGDILYSADDNNLVGVSVSVAQNMIRGQVGTPVRIGVIRQGQVLYFDIIREEIGEKQSVSYKIVSGTDQTNADKTEQVIYIKIYGFMDNTDEQFAKAMEEADNRDINNIIIDLRDNGGGYVKQAVNIANYFVPNGNVIVTEDHKVDLFDIVYKSNNTSNKQNDVVILINEYSASASELLAAAIRENDVGVIIGTTSYGKGTVQSSVSLKDGEAMKYTVAYYLTPSGANIDGIGVVPDAIVENGSVLFDISGYSDFNYASIYSIGDRDAEIVKAKQILNVWGWYTGDENDQDFDSELESSIIRFQLDQGLFPYGVLDITTQRSLFESLEKTTVSIDNQLEAAFSHFGISMETISE